MPSGGDPGWEMTPSGLRTSTCGDRYFRSCGGQVLGSSQIRSEQAQTMDAEKEIRGHGDSSSSGWVPVSGAVQSGVVLCPVMEQGKVPRETGPAGEGLRFSGSALAPGVFGALSADPSVLSKTQQRPRSRGDRQSQEASESSGPAGPLWACGRRPSRRGGTAVPAGLRDLSQGSTCLWTTFLFE